MLIKQKSEGMAPLVGLSQNQVMQFLHVMIPEATAHPRTEGFHNMSQTKLVCAPTPPSLLSFLKYYALKCFSKFSCFLSCSDLPKQNGKVAIVTGGTRGMGYEISRHLVSLDMHVIIGIVSSHT